MSEDGSDHELLVNVVPGETRVALVADGRLRDLTIARRGHESLTGAIYLGRVARVEPSLSAAFVEIGGLRRAFLPVSGPGNASAEGVTEGAAVVVQVGADAIAEKGPRVTTDITLPGRYLVLAPGRSGVSVSRRIQDKAEQERLKELAVEIGEAASGGAQGEEPPGMIVRTAAAEADAEALAADAAYLRAHWAEISARRQAATPPACLERAPDPVLAAVRDHGSARLRRVVIDDAAATGAVRRFCQRVMPEVADRLEHHTGGDPVFERYDIEDEIERLLERRVSLPCGAAIVIDELEALTAVDVDSAGLTSRARGWAGSAEANLEAVPEIARQLRLRRIAGLIVVDFIRMGRSEHRRRVLEALCGAFADDPVPAHVHGFTAAGLVEVTRPRTVKPLSRILAERCPSCAGGWVKTAQTVAFEVLRALLAQGRADPAASLTVAAAAEVIDDLRGPGRADLEAVEEALGRKAALVRADSFPRDRFEVTGARAEP